MLFVKNKAKDKQIFLNTGKHSKSAGSYKREWNEKKLLKEIQYVLSSWQEYLQHRCHKIFLHAPGVINEQTLFGTHDEQTYLYPPNNNSAFGNNHSHINQQLSNDRLNDIANTFNNVLKAKKEAHDSSKIHETSAFRLFKKDNRIFKIPLTTRAPSIQECNRIHSYLSNAWITFQKDNNVMKNLNYENRYFNYFGNNNNNETLDMQHHIDVDDSNMTNLNKNEKTENKTKKKKNSDEFVVI